MSHEEQLDPKVKGQIQGCDWLPPETELKAQKKKQKFTIDDEDCLKSTRTRKDVIISKTSDKKKKKIMFRPVSQASPTDLTNFNHHVFNNNSQRNDDVSVSTVHSLIIVLIHTHSPAVVCLVIVNNVQKNLKKNSVICRNFVASN